MDIKRALITTFGVVAMATLALFGTAGAQENPDYTAPAPVVEVTSPPVQQASGAPAAPAAQATASAGLALTGTDAIQLLVAGGVLVAGGAGLLAVRRRAAL